MDDTIRKLRFDKYNLKTANKFYDNENKGIQGPVDRNHDPDAFLAGEKDTTKRHTEYQNWRFKLVILWAQDSREFPDESKKVLHIANLLSGQAYQGVQKGVMTVLNNPRTYLRGDCPRSSPPAGRPIRSTEGIGIRGSATPPRQHESQQHLPRAAGQLMGPERRYPRPGSNGAQRSR